MRGKLPVVLARVFEEEVVDGIEAGGVPKEGEVGGGAQDVDEHKVLVVFLVGLSGFSDEAEPNTPLVEEKGVLNILHITINYK